MIETTRLSTNILGHLGWLLQKYAAKIVQTLIDACLSSIKSFPWDKHESASRFFSVDVFDSRQLEINFDFESFGIETYEYHVSKTDSVAECMSSCGW